jgi:DnaK suppressor protein
MTKEAELDRERIVKELEARRAELRDLMEDSAGAGAPVELDQAQMGRLSRADAMQRQAFAQEAERRRGLELNRIEAALQRIDAGNFGSCARCGEPIDPQRLEADPTTTFCIDCARE